MRKRDELSCKDSCMTRAHPEEMTFVLLGRDDAAPATIRAWVDERIRLGKNGWIDEQIYEALICADVMAEEGRKWVGQPTRSSGMSPRQLALAYRSAVEARDRARAETVERFFSELGWPNGACTTTPADGECISLCTGIEEDGSRSWLVGAESVGDRIIGTDFPVPHRPEVGDVLWGLVQRHEELRVRAVTIGQELQAVVAAAAGGDVPSWLAFCLLHEPERAGSGRWTVVSKGVHRVDADSRLMVLVCRRGSEHREAVVSGVTWEAAQVGSEIELREER